MGDDLSSPLIIRFLIHYERNDVKNALNATYVVMNKLKPSLRRALAPTLPGKPFKGDLSVSVS